MWGVEGEFWQGLEADGMTPKFTENYTKNKEKLADYQAKMDPVMWVGNTVYVDDIKGKFEATLPENERNWSTYWQYEITWKTQGDATEFINLSPLPDTEEGIAFQSAKDIWQKARAQALTPNRTRKRWPSWTKRMTIRCPLGSRSCWIITPSAGTRIWRSSKGSNGKAEYSVRGPGFPGSPFLHPHRRRGHPFSCCLRSLENFLRSQPPGGTGILRDKRSL
ncbi:hypothetical protein HMSSN139_47970 [Paenibacillus sp. HMSSN-139]|nr:hypothetical protein HMSSN139_47970 [Paenibacillus sp. HMSSN-139]